MKWLLLSSILAMAAAQYQELEACQDDMGACVMRFIANEGIDMNAMERSSHVSVTPCFFLCQFVLVQGI